MVVVGGSRGGGACNGCSCQKGGRVIRSRCTSRRVATHQIIVVVERMVVAVVVVLLIVVLVGGIVSVGGRVAS